MAQPQQKTVTSTYTAEKFQEDADKLMKLMKERVEEIEASFKLAETTFKDQQRQVTELEKEINTQTETIKKNQEDLAKMQNQLQELMTKNIEFYQKKDTK